MTALAICLAIGLLSGFVLMTRVPICPGTERDKDGLRDTDRSTTIIIPARNEENNLPRLLRSITPTANLAEIIVVDDGSTDSTRDIALQGGARVVGPGTPPHGYTGKAWACVRGAEEALSNTLLFLDADTFFEGDGLTRMLHAFAEQPPHSALSLLPYAVTRQTYEELSLFFNLLMAFGAGGFGFTQSPRLFGQSLLLSKDLYGSLGGHASVGEHVLGNFRLSLKLKAAGARSACYGGRGVLSMRMFPDGPRQLCDGWTKAFADGAVATETRVLLVSIGWLSALAAIPLCLLVGAVSLTAGMALYLVAAVQVGFFARQIGSFRALTCLFYPVPLVMFFLLFARSALRRATHRSTNWRGREV